MMSTRTRLSLLGAAALALASFGIGAAQASVTALSIDDAPHIVQAGESFDVTFTWDHSHCNSYGSTVELVGLVQTQQDYAAADLDCPGPNTRTESLTVPADAPGGPATLSVNVAEFTAGNGFDMTETQTVHIALGECPPKWTIGHSLGADDPYDANGDGLICTKDVDGQGNSANSQRADGAASASGHIDGHNHKDNNS